LATVLEGYTTEEQRFVVRFLWAKVLSAMDINKELFPVCGGKHCQVKRFTTGSRNSLKDFRKAQMMPDRLVLLRYATEATVV
jgi:hypothetical protein